MKKINKIFSKKVLQFSFWLGLFILLFLVIFYFCNPLSKFNRTFFRVAPYPLALINGNEVISTRDLLFNLESLEKFYLSQDFSEMGMRIDFETEEGETRLKIKEKEVFSKLIENKLIEIIANEKGIYVSKKEAGEDLVSKAQDSGSTENLALNLKKIYGWNLTDFRDKVVIPRIYLKKLIEYYESNSSKENFDRGEIEKALLRLQKGEEFEKIAKEYSEGETAENGGNLGWFKKDYLIEPIANEIYSMQPGDFSKIITSPLGNHIVYLEDKRGEGNQEEFKIKQIFTNEGSFLDWLNEEKSNLSVKIFSKDYRWNKEDARLDFSNEEMKKQETVLRDKSEGDPSLY